jgi:polysaccharide pyruvyl transferase WcaK-like protein
LHSKTYILHSYLRVTGKPMRINIVGQFGYGNVGDEGILMSIMDSLGLENEYIVSTSLPFTMTSAYSRRVPNVIDVRTLDDTRTDFDVCILGGGKVDWGFGWAHLLSVFAEGIPTMAYGIALRTDQKQHYKLRRIFSAFFGRFNRITTRDLATAKLLTYLEAFSTLTSCPAINLKEDKTTCPEGTIIVCPRYGDYNEEGEVDNKPQIDWFVERLEHYLVEGQIEKVMLIPFYPKDLEGQPRDLELCKEINRGLGGGCNIFPCDGYNARKVKHAISRSNLVISGGRYHAIVWAIAHGIPYEIAPTIGEPSLSKINGLVEMDREFGKEKLLEMERDNCRLFEAMF